MASVWSRFSTVVGALAAVGAIVWSGCGPGDNRYYCDNSGCYSCDAYGCSNVPPPGSTACTGTSNCAAGQVCTTTGCTTTCGSSADCPQGAVCTNNLCVPPGTTPPTPKECTTAAECKSGEQCVGNKCVPGPVGADGGSDGGADSNPPPDAAPQCTKGTDCAAGQACVGGKCTTCGGAAGPCACGTTSDCPSTDICVSGVCTPAADGCKFDSDCGDATKVCIDGKCESSCAGGFCPTGFTCVKGGCSPNPVGTTCSSNAQCSAPTPFCVGGTCVASCTNDTQCGPGNYCDNGACVPDTRPTGNCKTDLQCNSDAGGPAEQCLLGICKYSCTTDAQCAAIDVRIKYCAPDKVCRTFTEAHPACTSKADCAPTQSCVSNVCK